MPGGLAAWLDDSNDAKLQPKSKTAFQRNNPQQPRSHAHEATAAASPPSTPTTRQPLTATAACSPNVPIIDVDALTPCASSARPDKKTKTPLLESGRRSSSGSSSGSSVPKTFATKGPWNPFASDHRHHTQQGDAFARLLQGRTPSKPKSARAGGASPSLSTVGSSGATWDPFAERKENGGSNAFSRLLAASPGKGPGAAGKGRSLGGMRSSAGKRKRPVGSSLPNSASSPVNQHASVGAGAGEVNAATRFCQCPVCGERVIIELCSKHLDTECRGSDATTDLTSSPPSSPTDRLEKTSSTPSESTSTCAPSGPSTTRQRVDTPTPIPPPPPPPRNRHVAQKESGGSEHEGAQKGSSGVEPEGAGGHSTATSAGNSSPTIDALGGIGTPTGGGSENYRKKARSAGAVSGASSSPGSTPASGADVSGLIFAAPCKKSARGSTGGVAGSSDALISCPVCGKKVRADLCSRHLDTDCAGMSSADDPVLESSEEGSESKERVGGEGGKGAGGGGPEKGEGEGGASDRAAAEAKREKEASETAGGLTALGAELTCPVCLCVFEDAHTLPCSHRFCLECITGCFRSSKRQECPLCKVPAWKRDLKRDVPLQNIIIAYRRMTA